MPNCYTCSEEIIFDKTILSKTGKQIPLWPDKKNTHSHDEAGNPTRGPLPTANLTTQQTQQFNQYNRQQPQQQERFQAVAQKTTSQLGTEQQSRGGSYLDTKRIRVMLEEMAKEIQEVKIMLNEILNARTILDTNRYEGKNDQIYNVMKPFLNTQGVAASELLKDKQQQRDPLSINHGKIADINELAGVEDDDNDVDIDDDVNDNNDDDNKGVIKEEEDEDL